MGKLKSGAKSLFTIAMNAAKGIDQSVPEEVKKARLDICNNCPSKLSTGNCRECGCFLVAKSAFRQEKCPLGKWDSWTPGEE
jgi:hypothetical protein